VNVIIIKDMRLLGLLLAIALVPLSMVVLGALIEMFKNK